MAIIIINVCCPFGHSAQSLMRYAMAFCWHPIHWWPSFDSPARTFDGHRGAFGLGSQALDGQTGHRDKHWPLRVCVPRCLVVTLCIRECDTRYARCFECVVCAAIYSGTRAMPVHRACMRVCVRARVCVCVYLFTCGQIDRLLLMPCRYAVRWPCEMCIGWHGRGDKT